MQNVATNEDCFADGRQSLETSDGRTSDVVSNSDSTTPQTAQRTPPRPKSAGDDEVRELISRAGLLIGRSTEQVEGVAKRMIDENWISSVRSLMSLKQTDWQEMQIPKELEISMKNLLAESLVTMEDRAANAVETLVRVAGEQLNIDGDAIQHAVNILVLDNWFDCPEQLRDLPPEAWEALHINRTLMESIRKHPLVEVPNSDLARVLIRVGSQIGRSKREMIDIALRLTAQSGIKSAGQLKELSYADWLYLPIPMRILNELRVAVYYDAPSTVDDQSTRPNKSLFNFVPDETGWQRHYASTKDFVRPELAIDEFLTRVAGCSGRRSEDLVRLTKVLMDTHQVDTLDKLRLLPLTEWQAMGVSLSMAKEIVTASRNPVLLEYDSVVFSHRDDSSFPFTVAEAVAEMEVEILPNLLMDSVKSMLRLIESILCMPCEAARRRLRTSHPTFHMKAGRYTSAMNLLKGLGYKDAGECTYLLQTVYVGRLTEAHARLAACAQRSQSKSRRIKNIY